MKRILIFGSTGMLGHAVGKLFSSVKGFKVLLTHRNKKMSYGSYTMKFDPLTDSVWAPPVVDYVINCIGIIKPVVDKSRIDTVRINSLFPWELAQRCAQYGEKLIHITTDCVFSGSTGRYTEDSPHDCTDFYGQSKSLGEPTSAMVLRTSIIGEELHNNHSLVSWIKSMKGKEVPGYTNHLWNGITTYTMASSLEQIIKKNYYSHGVFHIHSPEDITKADLVRMVSTRFELGITVKDTKAKQLVDRTLRSKHDLVSNLGISPLVEQIKGM